MHEKRTGYVSLMTKEDWLSGKQIEVCGEEAWKN